MYRENMPAMLNLYLAFSWMMLTVRAIHMIFCMDIEHERRLD
jgi:hypothetical protein